MKIIMRPEIVDLPEGYHAIFFAKINDEEYLIILCPDDQPALSACKMASGEANDQLETSSISVIKREKSRTILTFANAYLSWQPGKIIFNNEPLTEIYFDTLTNNRFKS